VCGSRGGWDDEGLGCELSGRVLVGLWMLLGGVRGEKW
jgi:hypothetical protein